MTHEFSDDEYSCPDNEPTNTWVYNMFPNRYKSHYIKRSICVRKVRYDTKSMYKKCKTQVVKCHWCYSILCPMKKCIPQYMLRRPSYITPSKKHEKCLGCDNITCCPTGICEYCEKGHTYDMITDTVSIGPDQDSYDPFDLVINLNYPYNGVKLGEVICEEKGHTYVIKCGYIDTEKKGGGLSTESLKDLLNMIDDYKKNKKQDPKILFHCYAGISRSATVAIAYIAKSQNKTTQEVYEFAKQKRSRINPNNTFRKIINLKTEDEYIGDEEDQIMDIFMNLT